MVIKIYKLQDIVCKVQHFRCKTGASKTFGFLWLRLRGSPETKHLINNSITITILMLNYQPNQTSLSDSVAIIQEVQSGSLTIGVPDFKNFL